MIKSRDWALTLKVEKGGRSGMKLVKTNITLPQTWLGMSAWIWFLYCITYIYMIRVAPLLIWHKRLFVKPHLNTRIVSETIFENLNVCVVNIVLVEDQAPFAAWQSAYPMAGYLISNCTSGCISISISASISVSVSISMSMFTLTSGLRLCLCLHWYSHCDCRVWIEIPYDASYTNKIKSILFKDLYSYSTEWNKGNIYASYDKEYISDHSLK